MTHWKSKLIYKRYVCHADIGSKNATNSTIHTREFGLSHYITKQSMLLADYHFVFQVFNIFHKKHFTWKFCNESKYLSDIYSEVS